METITFKKTYTISYAVIKFETDGHGVSYNETVGPESLTIEQAIQLKEYSELMDSDPCPEYFIIVNLEATIKTNKNQSEGKNV